MQRSRVSKILSLVILAVFVATPFAQVLAQEAAVEAAEQAAPEGDAPGLPSAVTNPAISLEELEIRLVPLTREELATLADVWRGFITVSYTHLTLPTILRV